jgi:hypothetical protein
VPHLPEVSVLGVEVGRELCLAVEEERVVGGEQHAARDAVGVVHVVEGVGRHGVQRDDHVRVAILGAQLLQMARVVRVQGRVHAVDGPGEVVQPRRNLRTARSANCVRTCNATQTPITTSASILICEKNQT